MRKHICRRQDDNMRNQNSGTTSFQHEKLDAGSVPEEMLGVVHSSAPSLMTEALDSLNFQIEELSLSLEDLSDQLDPILLNEKNQDKDSERTIEESSQVVNAINSSARRIQNLRQRIDQLQNRLTV